MHIPHAGIICNGFAVSHHAKFVTLSWAMAILSTSTPLAPQKVREQGDCTEGIALMEVHDLEADIQHAEISPKPNICTSQII